MNPSKRAKISVITLAVLASSIFAFVMLSPDVYIFSYWRSLSISKATINTGNATSVDLLCLENAGPCSFIPSRVAYPGTYNSTYSFTGEPDGRHPIQGWKTGGTYADPLVVGIDGGHSKVVDLFNTSIYQDEHVTVDRNFVIEFWAKFYSIYQESTFLQVSSTNGLVFSISAKGDGPTNLISMKIANGTVTRTFCERENGTWSRLSLEWSADTSAVFITVNDTGYGSFPVANATRIDVIRFSDSCARIDAIGYSWDNQYAVGENRDAVKQFSAVMSVQFTGLLPQIEKLWMIEIRSTFTNVSSDVMRRAFSLEDTDAVVRCDHIASNISCSDSTVTIQVPGEKTLITREGILLIMSISSDEPSVVLIDSVEISALVLI